MYVPVPAQRRSSDPKTGYSRKVCRRVCARARERASECIYIFILHIFIKAAAHVARMCTVAEFKPRTCRGKHALTLATDSAAGRRYKYIRLFNESAAFGSDVVSTLWFFVFVGRDTDRTGPVPECWQLWGSVHTYATSIERTTATARVECVSAFDDCRHGYCLWGSHITCRVYYVLNLYWRFIQFGSDSTLWIRSNVLRPHEMGHPGQTNMVETETLQTITSNHV